MTYFPLTPEQHAWQERVAAVAAREIGPRAAETDRAARFPTASLEALRREGLWGLRVAQEHGGLGADALTTCLVVEEIAKHCPSTAMCYKMHLEACELLSRMPTASQVDHLVTPLAHGEVFATVAGARVPALATTGCRMRWPFPRSRRCRGGTSSTRSASPT